MRLILLALASVVALALPAQAETRPRAPLEPQRGALLGASVARDRFGEFERLVRHRLGIWHKWKCWDCPFPTAADERAAARGRILLFTWSPERRGADVSIDSIIDGSRDAWIRRQARAARTFGRPFYLRWGWEMNGFWSSWGCQPARFVTAWRRVWDLFRDEGATNVVWVWAPNWEGVCKNGAPDAGSYGPYWPGGRYVDWVGVSGYNRVIPWHSLAFLTSRARSFGARHAKPVMIAETASLEDGPGRKAAWITAGRRAMKRWPNVGALVWFHRGPTVEKPLEWRVNTSRSALRAFRALADDPYFRWRGDSAPPTVRAPAATFGAQISPGSVPVQIRWSAADASCVYNQRLQESVNGGAFGSVRLTTPTSRTEVRTQYRGRRYRYRVRASDCAGNVSTYKTGTSYTLGIDDDTSGRVTYSAGWGSHTTDNVYGGSTRWANSAGQTATYSFFGRRAAWVAITGPDRGQAMIYVDGAYATTVDLYAPAWSKRRVVFQHGWATTGAHRIDVVGVGTPGRPRVDVDAFLRMY